MTEAEFDRVADDYQAQHAASIRLSGEEPAYFANYKAEDARQIVSLAGLKPENILDFGCGVGNSIAPLRKHFPEAQITGLDVSLESLAVARNVHGDTVEYRSYDGLQIPADIGRFDLIFTACVFHHIPHAQHIALLRQIKALLKPGGRFILFEHNPWNPLTRHAVANCPFDANAVLISAPEMMRRFKSAGFCCAPIRYRIFFPALFARLRPLERYLTWLPLGAQYCLSGN
ncbi:MAG: hypothetical protein RLZZ08_748 [Pseudomonadota bacterium]|jgi:SAM-dependent methyltransferase